MPLVIYADVLVVVNLYVDFFLLWCVKKALGLRARARRLVLGALAGALRRASARRGPQPESSSCQRRAASTAASNASKRRLCGPHLALDLRL